MRAVRNTSATVGSVEVGLVVVGPPLAEPEAVDATTDADAVATGSGSSVQPLTAATDATATTRPRASRPELVRTSPTFLSTDGHGRPVGGPPGGPQGHRVALTRRRADRRREGHGGSHGRPATHRLDPLSRRAFQRVAGT